MKIGKLPESVLKRSVFKQIHTRRPEVVLGAGVGEDCAAIKLAEDETLVMSTDPITGTAKDLGHHSIHITANDLAAAGADPVGVMLTVMLPDTVEEPDTRFVFQQVFIPSGIGTLRVRYTQCAQGYAAWYAKCEFQFGLFDVLMQHFPHGVLQALQSISGSEKPPRCPEATQV